MEAREDDGRAFKKEKKRPLASKFTLPTPQRKIPHTVCIFWSAGQPARIRPRSRPGLTGFDGLQGQSKGHLFGAYPMAHQMLAMIRHKAASFHSSRHLDLEGRRIPEEVFREMDMVIS